MRAGFIIDGRIPTLAAISKKEMWPHQWVLGWDTSSAMTRMRFGWIAREINARRLGITYELYRPWRRYDVVVFVKSFTPQCHALACRLKARQTKVIFDINVDYLTPAAGLFYYNGMAPSPEQRAQALEMTQVADCIFAASTHLAGVCSMLNPRVTWVPDNVRLDIVPENQPVTRREPLELWWCGEAVKLFELLAIETVLGKFKERIHLHLVTSPLSALDRWKDGLKPRFLQMLGALPHTLHPFRSVPDLLGLYSRGSGVVISPRFLDNSYNFGHTEWKITLAMACGLPALCSPIPSYVEVAKRAAAGAITVCESDEDWEGAFAGLLGGAQDSAAASLAARAVVETHYSTRVVADKHLAALRQCAAL